MVMKYELIQMFAIDQSKEKIEPTKILSSSEIVEASLEKDLSHIGW